MFEYIIKSILYNIEIIVSITTCIILFFTLIAICWYTLETKRLSNITKESILLTYYSAEHRFFLEAERAASDSIKYMFADDISDFLKKHRKSARKIEQL